MKIVKVSDGLIFIPHSAPQIFALWLLSFFAKGYEKTYNEEAYPVGRRFKVDFSNI
ncbi:MULTISPECIES: hypothetical protein [Vibrio]|uniref:hypothetical protein n=1 Tax=Vibrio TaxID=662 RepID=UPI001300095E|nr:hypothetical protein [Vibrio tasmaniensis]